MRNNGATQEYVKENQKAKDRCPLCGIELKDGVCPKCGYKH